jgi:ParB family transcriptional regulator, chromosome partitioning protein
MADTFKGLGKGLDALIPEGDYGDNTATNEVNINLVDVNPHQPRTTFDEEALKELAGSIKKHGILQPLVVTPNGDHYELIAGERRLRASKLAGLTKVPVVIREAKDHQKLELAIIENVHRSDLNPIDEALSYRHLIEQFNYTQEQAAEAVGKSRTVVANKLRILTLPTDIKRAIKEGKISEGHAKVLLSIDDPKKQQLVFEKILAEGLSVRDVEAEAKKHSTVVHEHTRVTSEVDLATKHLADDLSTYFSSRVAIKKSGKGGKVEIEYYSDEELNRIYQKIKGIE